MVDALGEVGRGHGGTERARWRREGRDLLVMGDAVACGVAGGLVMLAADRRRTGGWVGGVGGCRRGRVGRLLAQRSQGPGGAVALEDLREQVRFRAGGARLHGRRRLGLGGSRRAQLAATQPISELRQGHFVVIDQRPVLRMLRVV